MYKESGKLHKPTWRVLRILDSVAAYAVAEPSHKRAFNSGRARQRGLRWIFLPGTKHSCPAPS